MSSFDKHDADPLPTPDELMEQMAEGTDPQRKYVEDSILVLTDGDPQKAYAFFVAYSALQELEEMYAKNAALHPLTQKFPAATRTVLGTAAMKIIQGTIKSQS